MYDVPFSEQWILDLCLSDVNKILVFIIIPIVFFILATIFQFKKIKDKKILISMLIASIVAYAIFYLFYVMIFFTIGIFNCSMQTFYRGVNFAHPIHAQIKQRISENRNIPQNLADLQKMDPENYKEMTQYAKVNYLYDLKTKTYTFFVRPSKYGLVLFDSKNDYKIYDLNSFLKSKDNDPTGIWGGTYPPDYPGPWDKLPE